MLNSTGQISGTIKAEMSVRVCIYGNVLHKTKIELNEKGTKAAAVTAITAGGGADISKTPVFVYLDRPFVYMIVDKNNVPLFIGAVTQLGE